MCGRALAVCVRQSAWRHASGVTSQHAAVAPLAAPRWPSIHTSPVLRDAVSELERPSLATRPYKLLKDGQESLVARPKVLRLPSAYQAYKEALVTVDELSGEPYGVCPDPPACSHPTGLRGRRSVEEGPHARDWVAGSEGPRCTGLMTGNVTGMW